jgi:antitoxin CptB
MSDYNKSKFYWAARRGMLELDLFLMPFVENEFDSLSEEQKANLESLLTCTDMELYVWLSAKEIPPAEFMSIVELIRQYARDSAKAKCQ